MPSSPPTLPGARPPPPLRVELTGDIRQLVVLRTQCARHLRSLPAEIIGDVQLVVTELAANVVLHTPHHTGRVVVWQEPGDVHVAVSDRSSNLPSLPHQAPGGGRGMGIVDAVAHAWGVDRGPSGKTVWADIAVRR